jgi:hypothetical protein
MHAHQQYRLVGPGSELQLTLDGRAVPHTEVVEAARGTRGASPSFLPPPKADAPPPASDALTAL